MGYAHTNSVGKTYYLHTTKAANGATLYFFSKDANGGIDLPDGYEIGENSRSKLPIVKKKK